MHFILSMYANYIQITILSNVETIKTFSDAKIKRELYAKHMAK